MFKCYQCELTFTFHYELIVHRNVHNVQYNDETEEFMCELCDIKCFNADHLKNHINKHVDNSSLFTCGICSKAIQLESTFVNHIKYHYRQFVCVLCDKEFKSKRNLTEHVRCHTREIQFQCHVCTKLFLRQDKMTAHMKVHSRKDKKEENKTLKTFKCSHYEKLFSRKENLTLHELLHTGGSTAICKCCGQHFLRFDHLERHKTLHKCNYTAKECRCVVCLMWFPKHVLQMHMKQHHFGKTPYKCSSCDKSFKSKGNLIFHQRTHPLKPSKMYNE